jgi:hypothetical protein
MIPPAHLNHPTLTGTKMKIRKMVLPPNAQSEQPNVDGNQVDDDSASRSFCSCFSFTEDEGADEGANQ